ncbi:OX-2 membrane glycoprotein-like isoform X2 [Toxotes jaculatrix]|uniref:OX-2 membrane glycoprotein-like isoform X2 n=1 Tax=Toxotes jaculatrix TaxID=941984 RepID=UPI001B3A8372|nr:OX-2 membrane glycoprotein-like isoform X2 [Toxotes jaculatrix]
MAHRAVVHVLFALGLFHKSRTDLIQTAQTVEAAVGGEACLNCQLTQSKDVLQITWQKVLSSGEKDLATYSERFGPRVNPAFKDKVEIIDSGLKNSSIVIREVTEQDEGCYRCLFNAYPDGALIGRTCLQLYELHEPILHVRESQSVEELVVSCSATGRPAPTVTLSVTQPHLYLSHNNTDIVHDANGTVCVTSTAVLSGFRDNTAQVGCAARVLSGQKEVFLRIPEVKQTSDGLNEESGSDNRHFIVTWSVLLLCGCVAVVIFVCSRINQNQENRNHEMSEIPQTNNINTPRQSEDTQETDGIRKRTPETNQESNHSASPPSPENSQIRRRTPETNQKKQRLGVFTFTSKNT